MGLRTAKVSFIKFIYEIKSSLIKLTNCWVKNVSYVSLNNYLSYDNLHKNMMFFIANQKNITWMTTCGGNTLQRIYKTTVYVLLGLVVCTIALYLRSKLWSRVVW